MVSLNIIILGLICSSSIVVPISCQKSQESTFKSYSDSLAVVKRSPIDPDAIVFRDDDYTSPQTSRSLDSSRITYESELSPMRPQTRIANNRRSRPKSEPINNSERQRWGDTDNNYDAPKSQSRFPQNENSRRNNYERTSSYSSTYQSTRRTISDPSSITFPNEESSYPYAPIKRRPPQKQSEPRHLQRNTGRDNVESKSMVPTGDVPYSYLYKWIKQYHKKP